MSTDSRSKSEPDPKWRKLAQQACEEPDGHKVTELVRQICDTLDQEEAEKKRRARPAPSNGHSGE
jgi:hypothetical protein